MEYDVFIVFQKANGQVVGFYNNREVLETVLQKQADDVTYCMIDKAFQMSILSMDFSVDINRIESEDTIIDSLDYLLDNAATIKKKHVNLDRLKQKIIYEIRITAKDYITSGTNIEVRGETKRFTFYPEDQSRLKEIIDNYTCDDTVYYSSIGEFDKEYSYDEIKNIYITLFNNKVYNQIYSDVLCKWVYHNYTDEMAESGENVVAYGYSNDEILKEVYERYETSRLSKP